MSNSADAVRKVAEPSAKEAVRRVLDTVKVKAISLTAPEGKLVAMPMASRSRRKASPSAEKPPSSRRPWAFRWS